jgi:hypothetical protein
VSKLLLNYKTAEQPTQWMEDQTTNRTSGDVAASKMLTYAYLCVTRTLFACMDLDAKSCYDRIVAGDDDSVLPVALVTDPISCFADVDNAKMDTNGPVDPVGWQFQMQVWQVDV